MYKSTFGRMKFCNWIYQNYYVYPSFPITVFNFLRVLFTLISFSWFLAIFWKIKFCQKFHNYMPRFFRLFRFFICQRRICQYYRESRRAKHVSISMLRVGSWATFHIDNKITFTMKELPWNLTMSIKSLPSTFRSDFLCCRSWNLCSSTLSVFSN